MLPPGRAKARHEALTERIRDIGEDDRDFLGLLGERAHGPGGMREDGAGRGGHQLRRMGLKALRLPAAPAIVDAQILARRPSQCFQPLLECGDELLPFGVALRVAHQGADLHRASLGACNRGGNQCRARQECQEFASVHWITSSATAITAVAIPNP